MTLFFDPNGGPLVRYARGELAVVRDGQYPAISWGMSRWEMVMFGMKCIVAAAVAGRRVPLPVPSGNR